jgi:hypothetical protein
MDGAGPSLPISALFLSQSARTPPSARLDLRKADSGHSDNLTVQMVLVCAVAIVLIMIETIMPLFGGALPPLVDSSELTKTLLKCLDLWRCPKNIRVR